MSSSVRAIWSRMAPSPAPTNAPRRLSTVQPEPLSWTSPVAFETNIDPAGHQGQDHVHRHARRTPVRRKPDQEPDEQPDDEMHEGEHGSPRATVDQDYDDGDH